MLAMSQVRFLCLAWGIGFDSNEAQRGDNGSRGEVAFFVFVRRCKFRFYVLKLVWYFVFVWLKRTHNDGQGQGFEG